LTQNRLGCFFRLVLTQPVWVGLDLAGPGWSLVHTSDLAGHCACINELFTHALHSDRVIIFLRGRKTEAYLCRWERSRRWWCIGRCSLCSSFHLFPSGCSFIRLCFLCLYSLVPLPLRLCPCLCLFASLSTGFFSGLPLYFFSSSLPSVMAFLWLL
jgi:hypothetical protein